MNATELTDIDFQMPFLLLH